VKNILLLRHAKSAWKDAALADHDRPLSRRGERAAKAIADQIVAHAPRPDLILCSTATRARQTLAPLAKRLTSPGPPVSLEKDLYLVPEDALLARLQRLPDEIGTVLLIGHNDGIGNLAADLAGRGKAAIVAALQQKFPTGALAVLQAPARRWRELAVGSAELTDFVRPRDLEGKERL